MQDRTVQKNKSQSDMQTKAKTNKHKTNMNITQCPTLYFIMIVLTIPQRHL